MSRTRQNAASVQNPVRTEEPAEDRRAEQTRMALIHALLELIESSHYDNITVQEIARKAGVGRSTFYAHFSSKDALLLGGFGHLLESLVRNMALDADGLLAFDVTDMFRHARGHYSVYRTLNWGSGFDVILHGGPTALSRILEKRMRTLVPDCDSASIPPDLMAASLAGGLLILLKGWLDRRMDRTPEEMNGCFQRLILSGVRTALAEGTRLAG